MPGRDIRFRSDLVGSAQRSIYTQVQETVYLQTEGPAWRSVHDQVWNPIWDLTWLPIWYQVMDQIHADVERMA